MCVMGACVHKLMSLLAYMFLLSYRIKNEMLVEHFIIVQNDVLYHHIAILDFTGTQTWKKYERSSSSNLTLCFMSQNKKQFLQTPDHKFTISSFEKNLHFLLVHCLLLSLNFIQLLNAYLYVLYFACPYFLCFDSYYI